VVWARALDGVASGIAAVIAAKPISASHRIERKVRIFSYPFHGLPGLLGPVSSTAPIPTPTRLVNPAAPIASGPFSNTAPGSAQGGTGPPHRLDSPDGAMRVGLVINTLFIMPKITGDVKPPREFGRNQIITTALGD